MLIILYIVSFLTRLVFLYFGYPSVTHDEADFYLNGYMLAKTGTDIHQNFLFSSSGLLTVISPIPVYISSLFFHIFPKTVFFSRLPFALINSLIPVLIAYIVYRLTKKKEFSFLVFLVANFSPWLSYLSSQAAFDSPISFSFYLVAVSILLTKLKPKIKYVFFLIFSFLAFNSYMGIKISFLPLIFTGFLIKRIAEDKKIKLGFVLKSAVISLIVFVAFTGLIFALPGNNSVTQRTLKEIILFDNANIIHTVWYERYVMYAPNIIKTIISNKLTVIFNNFFDKYLFAFDPRLLFFKGDPHPLYGTYYFGLFYLFELIFAIVGLIKADEIFKNKKIVFLPMVLICLFAPLPVGLASNYLTVVLRAYPLLLPYSFLIATGAYYCFKAVSKKLHVKPDIYKSFTILYILSFLFFFFIFNFKIKVLSSEQWHYSEKVLAEKLYSVRNQYKTIYVYTGDPKETLLLYDFYTEQNASKIKNSLIKTNDFRIGNIRFIVGCPKGNLDSKNLYLIKRLSCELDKYEKTIAPAKITSYIKAYDGSGDLYYKIDKVDQ